MNENIFLEWFKYKLLGYFILKEYMAVKPIQPQQITPTFPDEVLEAFNELLQEKGNSNSITIKQDEAIDRVMDKFRESNNFHTRSEIFDNHWLDIEDTYRNAGWKVTFDKPGYCESYNAHWIFKK